MELTIDFLDALERCRMESAFIGRSAEEQTNDELRYANNDDIFSRHYIGKFDLVRIRSGDEQLIMTYIAEGAHKLENQWRWLMTGMGSYTTATAVWQFSDRFFCFNSPPPETIHDEEPWTIADLPQQNNNHDNAADNDTIDDDTQSWLYAMAIDLIAAYALHRWLADKIPTLAANFLQRYEDTNTTFCSKIAANTMRTPRKRFF